MSGFVFSKKRRLQTTGPFYPSVNATLHSTRIKRFHRESSRGVHRENINTVSNVFNFCTNDYDLAENTKFLSKSNFNSSANFGPLMTNEDALE